MIDCLRTCVRKEPIIALYFEFETVLKFYNLEASTKTPIPHRPRIPRIDKYLDSWLNRTQFVKVLTDSHSP